MNNRIDARVGSELRDVVQASPTPLMAVGDDGVILHANEALSHLFEYLPGELDGLSVELLVPSASRGHHHELRAAFHQIPTRRSMGRGRDLKGQTKSGKLIPVEIGLDPRLSGAKNIVFVSVNDIRERVAAAQRLTSALNAVSNGVIMLDADGKIVLVNDEACHMFGYERDELLGETVELLVPRSDRRRHQVYRASYSLLDRARPMGAGKSLIALRKDGSEFPVQIGLTPIHSPEGKLTMSTVMDLTQTVQHQQAIEEKNRKLSILNAELTQFAYSASHDLKAPLSSIAGLMSVALDDIESGDINEVRENLCKALGLSSRLAARIEALLAIAKAEDAVGTKVAVEINQLLADSAQTLKPSDWSEPNGVELDLRFTGTIFSNPTMLQSVFDNLIGNAFKYSDTQKKHHWVGVSTESRAGDCVVSIRDNGPGIPADRHGDVFKMFKRFSNKAEGSGLGLALVQKYVALLGGEITFKSSSEGSIFQVRLPIEGAGE